MSQRGGKVGDVTRIDPQTDSLVPSWLTLSEAAEQLDLDVKRVRHMVHERKLLAVDRGEREAHVPDSFIREGQLVKGLPGTLTLLADAGFDDDESLRWLFTPDDSLPGAPIDALTEDRGKEVKRRAQALGF